MWVKKSWTSLKKIIRRENSLMRHREILVKRLMMTCILYISVLFLGYSITVYMVKLFFLNLTNGMILGEYTYIHTYINTSFHSSLIFHNSNSIGGNFHWSCRNKCVFSSVKMMIFVMIFWNCLLVSVLMSKLMLVEMRSFVKPIFGVRNLEAAHCK